MIQSLFRSGKLLSKGFALLCSSVLTSKIYILSQYLFPCDFVKGLIDMDELLSFRNEIAWVLESRLWSFNG